LADLILAFPDQEIERLTKTFINGLPLTMETPRRSKQTRDRIEEPLRILSGFPVSKRTSIFEDLFLIISSHNQKFEG